MSPNNHEASKHKREMIMISQEELRAIFSRSDVFDDVIEQLLQELVVAEVRKFV